MGVGGNNKIIAVHAREQSASSGFFIVQGMKRTLNSHSVKLFVN